MTTSDSYIDRNWRWLCPLVGAGILSTLPVVGEAFDSHPVPPAATIAFVGIALVWAGIAARLTDTLSARVVCGTVTAAGLIAGGVMLVKFIGEAFAA